MHMSVRLHRRWNSLRRYPANPCGHWDGKTSPRRPK